ncbi:hypothetical protein LOD99_15171 [Oopsacas minuta]|uniref:Uncharacterized protein n=1 Tax=Oopsacas minuta TaxID=111878 RepID=A0AAV7KCQ0_9METZ|nr:hypothetical protein LOD99_15171 [Oopsacas minuta]
MIAESVLNTAGVPSSTVSLSKSTIHRQRQKQRQKSAQEIRQGFSSTKSVVHWDGKLLPDTDESTQLIDRIAVLLASFEDSSTKLLESLSSCQELGKKLLTLLKDFLSRQYYGACVLLENLLEWSLLWLVGNTIFEVLLSDVFTTCKGPSSGPDILLFKHFRSTWPKLHHQSQDTIPLVDALTDVLQFLRTTMDAKHPRKDYLELFHPAANMVGLPVVSSLRRPGVLERARWMSWYSCSLAVDAAFNDIALIHRLQEYDDVEMSRVGLRMMVRHSWHLSPELASLALFSNHVHDEVKVQLVAGMQQDRGRHLLTKLWDSFNELHHHCHF